MRIPADCILIKINEEKIKRTNSSLTSSMPATSTTGEDFQNRYEIEKELIIDQFDLCGVSGTTDFVNIKPLDGKDEKITMKDGLPFIMANQFVKKGSGKAIVCAVGRQT
jgi:hypothetical protein